jgi:hypothetical protein
MALSNKLRIALLLCNVGIELIYLYKRSGLAFQQQGLVD